MPYPAAPFRTAFRAVATCAAVLVVLAPAPAQPPMRDLETDRSADAELKRRMAPLVPSVRAALEGDNKDAQRAALSIAPDFPALLAIDGKLHAVIEAFLKRDSRDAELTALGLRSYGRIRPEAVDLARVVGKHSKADSAEVREAVAEALTSALQNATPGITDRTVTKAKYFIETATHGLPLLGDLAGDTNPRVQRAALSGVRTTAQVVTDLYNADRGYGGGDAAPAGPRFAAMEPVLRGLAGAIPKLAVPLASPDVETRAAAARTLESVGTARRTILNTRPVGEPAPSDPFPNAWTALRPGLVERVRDADPRVRLAAVESMESVGDVLEARELLRSAAGDRDAFVRWAAARALGRTAPPKPVAATVADDVEVLARLTGDSDSDVRTAAITALARFGPAAQPATAGVLAAAGRGDIEPRISAVRALTALDTDAERTVPVLIAALQDSDMRLQRAAAAGLVRFGPAAKAALPELRKAVTSTDTELRLAAAEAILSIERQPRLKEL